MLDFFNQFPKSGKQGFVNLFENPFLAHVLDTNWEMIRNLSEVGLNMHDKSITKLKKDLGVVYHKYLTKEADVEIIDTTPNFDVVRIRRAKDFFALTSGMRHPKYFLRSNSGLMARCSSVRKRVLVCFC